MRSEDNRCLPNFPDKVEWSQWTQWLPCECRTASVQQKRNRTCSYPYKYQEGLVCPEGTDEDRPCQVVPGCKDGNWGDWHNWGRCECSGDILQHRFKHCDDPPPTNGGLNCVGSAPKASRECATDECDEPGKPTEPRVTNANTRPEDNKSKSPLTQPRTTVPRVIVKDPDPPTFKTGIKSTTLPNTLLPEPSTEVNVLASVSSKLTIVGAVCPFHIELYGVTCPEEAFVMLICTLTDSIAKLCNREFPKVIVIRSMTMC